MSDLTRADGQASKDQRLAALLREAGLLSTDDLERALAHPQRGGKGLLHVLTATGTLSFDDLQDVLLGAQPTVPAVSPDDRGAAAADTAAGEDNRSFDERKIDDDRLRSFLLAQGRVTQEQLDIALKEQEHTGHPLWRTLINLELLTPQDMMEILKSQGERWYSQDRVIAEALQAVHRFTPEQLQQIERERQVNHSSLARLCIEKGWLSRAELGQILEHYLHVPFVDVHGLAIEGAVFRLLPFSYLREHQVLPVRVEGEELCLAMVDPLNLSVVDSISLLTGYRVQPMLALEADLQEVLEARAGMGIPPASLARRREAEWRSLEVDETATAVQLSNAILEGAVRARATDIHIEPQLPSMRVRYRIDGMLFDVLTVPPDLQMSLISRIKILADMDITERRLPQDGHIAMHIGGQEHNLRVATIPTTLGEKLVLR
ncbi:MAG: Flp pilus assembly complex ATPase component TadA, partial [Nitrospinae bacterium]|nr:Flp pilus assembly complex ATPase component TadA [Nitrospinota bacterium]